MKPDKYLDHLNEVIEGLEKQLEEAKAARSFHIKHHGAGDKSFPQLRVVQPSDDEVSRKGLRTKGRTRDIFEYLDASLDPVNMADLAEATKYSSHQISQFYHRFYPAYIQKDDKGNISLNPAGKELVMRSQPYAGENSGVLLQRMMG